MQDKVRAGYDKASYAYQAGRDQFNNEKYLQKLTKLLKPNSTILDIGCGSGKPVDTFLINKGHSVIGIDISKEQIKLARLNVPNATFHVRDMSKLQNGEFKVDAVVSFYAIFHIPRTEHEHLLNKIYSYLSPDGLLLITMGSSDWQGSEEFFGVEMHWSHFGKDKNIQIVKDAGFRIILDEIDETGGEKHQVILAEKVKGVLFT